MGRVSGCRDGLPRARCDAVTLIKERDRAPVTGSSVRRVVRTQTGDTAPPDLHRRGEAALAGRVLGGLRREEVGDSQGVQPACYPPLPPHDSTLPFPDCAGITMTTRASGCPGIHSHLEKAGKKKKTSFAFCTQPRSSWQINIVHAERRRVAPLRALVQNHFVLGFFFVCVCLR